MKKLILSGCLGLLPLSTYAVSHNPDVNRSPLQTEDLSVSFDNKSLGYYKGDSIWEDWITLAWDGTKNRAQIYADKDHQLDHFLRVNYPKDGVGPLHSGAQFLVHLPPSDEYWLTYKVRFNGHFDFKLGGKLPGFASGQGKYANGVIPTDGKGWTARLMWVRDGELVPYLYYVDMPKENRWGHFWSMGSFIKPDQWHTITQHVRLNTNGQRNGLYQIWIDGKQVANKADMLWRFGNYGQIDSFIFGTYHGGATPEWAPSWNSTADFDDMSISRQMPTYLRNTPVVQTALHPLPQSPSVQRTQITNHDLALRAVNTTNAPAQIAINSRPVLKMAQVPLARPLRPVLKRFIRTTAVPNSVATRLNTTFQKR
jgi:hypothetical protein